MDEIPIDIATKVAIETLISDEAYEDTYGGLVLDLRTLVRNVIASQDDHKLPTPRLVINDVQENLDVIKSVIKIPVMALYHDYKLPTNKGIFRPRIPRTDKQKEVSRVEKESIRSLLRVVDIPLSNMSRSVQLEPGRKNLIMTSSCITLALRFNTEMVLLEAMTGKLKPESLWYTKYYPIPERDMAVFPMNKTLLGILGDRHLYSPLKVGLRKQVHDLAAAKRWNFNTTEDLVRAQIKRTFPDLKL